MGNRNIKVRVFCQVWENYNDRVDWKVNPHWKPKGGKVFVFNIDSDVYWYDPINVVDTFKRVIEGECDECFRYEYREHEPELDGEPEDLTHWFDQLYNKVPQ